MEEKNFYFEKKEVDFPPPTLSMMWSATIKRMDSNGAENPHLYRVPTLHWGKIPVSNREETETGTRFNPKAGP